MIVAKRRQPPPTEKAAFAGGSGETNHTLNAESRLVPKSFKGHLHPFFAEAQFIPHNPITYLNSLRLVDGPTSN